MHACVRLQEGKVGRFFLKKGGKWVTWLVGWLVRAAGWLGLPIVSLSFSWNSTHLGIGGEEREVGRRAHHRGWGWGALK
jgi:hypothetical protein